MLVVSCTVVYFCPRPRRYCAARGCSAGKLASTLSLDGLAPDLDASIDLVTFVAGVDPGAFGSTDDATMGAIEAASAPWHSGVNATGTAGPAAAAAVGGKWCELAGTAPGVWKRCASGAGCYKASMECDGGVPDCEDGSDEGALVCDPAPVRTRPTTPLSRNGGAV